MVEKMLRRIKMKEFLSAFIWKFFLFVGTVPFLVPLFMGIHRAITSHQAFIEFILIYSYLLWPTYLVGLVLIIFGIYKVK